MQHSAIGLILQAGPVVKAVLFLLLSFSVLSWAIIIMKLFQIKTAEKENGIFRELIRRAESAEALYSASKRLASSPSANVFRYVCSENTTVTSRADAMRYARRAESMERHKLERYLSFLATTGSTAPFIGLFGTVWGIMNSFMGIGAAGAASLAVVAPGIAEALIATAMGLVAAIPAVIAYNFYVSKVRGVLMEMEDMSEEAADFLLRKAAQGGASKG